MEKTRTYRTVKLLDIHQDADAEIVVRVNKGKRSTRITVEEVIEVKEKR